MSDERMTLSQALVREQDIYEDLKRRQSTARQAEADYWSMGKSALRAECEQLLWDVPDSALPRVADMMRDLIEDALTPPPPAADANGSADDGDE